MSQSVQNEAGSRIAGRDDTILVTGASGFIGSRVVENLRKRGFRKIRCLVRASTAEAKSPQLFAAAERGEIEIVRGNLLAKDDCMAATRDARAVIHLAAGRGEKSYPDAVLNSVVTTRNLLDACLANGTLQRFVNVSSFAVYDATALGRREVLTEATPLESHPELRGEAYCFAKTMQEALISEYRAERGIPAVILRPGWVYGPGNLAITGRVGIGTFGLFLHLGGGNKIPACHVDNCAEAIVLAALTPGIDGEAFNVVDDDLPTSRSFLRQYKRQVAPFSSLYLPRPVSYALCVLWEKYSVWSEGQLPRSFNQRRWHSVWGGARYTNHKLKTKLGWRPVISTEEGLRTYFEACRAGACRA